MKSSVSLSLRDNMDPLSEFRDVKECIIISYLKGNLDWLLHSSSLLTPNDETPSLIIYEAPRQPERL